MTINPFILHGEEITPVRKLLYLKAFAGGGALSEYEVTGNPVAFNTNVAKPLSAFTIPFLPIQSGTGDPSPENVRPITGWSGAKVTRSGKNMYWFNADNLAVSPTYSGSTLSGDRAVYHTGIFADGVTSFTLSATRKDASVGTGRNINFGVFRNSAVYITAIFIKETEEQTPTVKPNAGEELVFVTTNDNTETLSSNLQKFDIQIEIGSSASPYAEYTGQSYPVTFPATGKNLIHPTPYGGQLFNVQAGTDLAQTTVRASSEESGNTITVTVTHQWYGVFYSTDMLPPGTYNIHLEPGEHCRVSSYVADKDFIALSRNAITSNNKVITLTETARIVVTISNDNSEPGSVTLTNLQVESGGSYTAWEAFTNTVYGGTVYPLEGKMLVEWAFANLNSESAWGSYGTGADFLVYVTKSDMQVGSSLPGYCDMFPSTFSNTDANIRFGADDNVIRLYHVDTLGVTDLSEWKEFIGTDGINVCYPLATPYEIPLSYIPVPVTLIGDNTIWTDTNGENTVRYLKKG